MLRKTAYYFGKNTANLLFMVGDGFNISNSKKSVYSNATFKNDDVLALAADWSAIGEEVEIALESYGRNQLHYSYGITNK